MARRLPLLVVLGLLACQQTASSVPNTLEYPMGVRVACRDATGSFRGGGDCLSEGGSLLALVLDPALYEIKAIDWVAGEYLDASATTPGFNGWSFEGLPRAVVAESGGPGLVAGVSEPDRLVRFSLTDTATTVADVDASPRALEWFETPDGRFLALLLDGQPRLELRDPTTLELVDTLDLPHVPDRLALSSLPGVLAWTYRDVAAVGWVDLATRDLHLVPFLRACENGLDDDGDGLADARDPGCEHEWDADEVDPAVAADAGECANGQDDDGDGTIDAADAGCRGSNGDAEGADALLCTAASDGTPRCGTRLFSYPCADGLDNDGDGAIDRADAGCLGVFDLDEGPDPRPLATGFAFLPDGLRVVVAEGRYGALHVLDLEAGLETPTGELPLLQRAERVPGVPLPVTALRVVAASASDDGTVPVYALAADGLVYRLLATDTADATDAAAPSAWQLSMIEIEEPSDTSLTKPLLQDGELAVEVGLTSPFAYPGFGVMEVAEQPDGSSVYYGIVPAAARADVRSETWTLEYEGLLPKSRGQRGALDAASGSLIDPSADFCELGVEAGDRLVLRLPEVEPDCAPLLGRDWEVPIEAVSRDRLTVTLDALAPADGVAPAKPPVLAGACGRSGLRYEVRSSGSFLVTGGRTGLLHPWTSQAGRCVARPDADPLFAARAKVARPVDPLVELDACPALGDAVAFEAETFQNPSFQLTLYPGCERLESLKYRPVAPERDVRWRFRITGGVQPRWIATGGLPEEMVWVDEISSLFFADPARGATYAIEETVDGALSGDVYY